VVLPADAAGPAPIVIEIPSSPRVVARPLTTGGGAIVGWATARDGNSVLITLPGGDARDAGYITIHTGRVTQLVRGTAADPVLQSVAPSAIVIEARHDRAPGVHVARPEIILTPTP
jgi:hypothetical protein